MVNVTSEIPFNLHNKPLPALDPSSSSRSVSASTTRESQSPSAPIRHHRTVRIRSPLQRTPSDSADASPPRSRSKSSSNEHDEDADDLQERASHPILNVRLVRGCPQSYGAIARRGRAPVRAGRGHLDGMIEREASGDSGKGKERAHDDIGHAQGRSPPDGEHRVGSGAVDDSVTCVDHGPASSESLIGEPRPRGQDDDHSDQNTPTARFCPPLPPLPTPVVNFQIHDIGAITLSFGE